MAGWHVLGLIHRADKNYVEAVKCYNQAMRIDPVSVQGTPLSALAALFIASLSRLNDSKLIASGIVFCIATSEQHAGAQGPVLAPDPDP